MARTARIAVIGGGIGGLVAAQALRPRGFEVSVYEAAPELKEIGAGVALGPNAMKALRSLDLERRSGRSHGNRSRMLRNWKTGRVISRSARQGQFERFGAAGCDAHRADLLDVLAAALPGRIVTLGARCVSVGADGDVAAARFNDGSEIEADVDRRRRWHPLDRPGGLFGPDAPRFTGKICYRSVIPVDAVPGGPPGPDHHLAGSAWRDRGLPRAAGRADQRGLPLRRRDVQARVLDHRMRPRGGARALWGLARIARADVLGQRGLVQVGALRPRPDPAVDDGPRTVLGDAAHPMLPYLGQGACQTIEDGCVLAAALDSTPDDLPGALGSTSARDGRVPARSS